MASSSTASHNQTELENVFEHPESYSERRQNQNCLMVIIKLLQEWVQSFRNDLERICPVTFIRGASAPGVSRQTPPSSPFQSVSMAATSHTAASFDNLNASASAFNASSSGTKQTPYDVFINHCGKDVKYTLASRIYDSLDATGLRVFLDKDELKPGDYFPKAIEEAIKSSSIHIAIFSEHYAESPGCLAELVCMLETPSKFIPIFYDVEPYILKWAIEGKGKYSDAFSEYVKNNRYPSELQRWKQALEQASFLTGEIIKKENQGDEDEDRAVKKLVNLLMNKMNLEVAKYPVGLDEAVKDFYDTITPQSVGSTQVVGIWGMGGSGKTTLAKEIFNRRSSVSSFLSDVRDAHSKGLLLEKQKTLLKDLGAKDVFFDNLDQGKQILNERLSRNVSVLIVLDDVDHIDQLDALLPPKESLGGQSLVILTTRNASVFEQWGISAIYRMRLLNNTNAKQLFCRHAFQQNIPPPEFEDLVEKFLNACQGLPLSLKVLGEQLYGRSEKDYWQRTFNNFSWVPHEDNSKRLKVSYDALGKQDQEMFLDAACLFIGRRKSSAIAAWDAEKNWDGLLGWETLFNKCLVEEDEDGLIRMHNHLRDLGRDIANAQSPYRLWSPQQVIEITPQQEAIRVRGMVNAVGDNCYQRQGEIIINTSEGERSRAPDFLGLKIFVGDADFLNRELSRDLIWLRCNKFKHESLSPWLSLKNLTILELFDSESLEHLWVQDADAPSQLKELVIRGCKSLAGIPTSLGNSPLSTLTIQSCKELKSLPDSLAHHYFLRELTIENTGVKCLPKSLINLQSLTIKETPISELSFGSGCMLKSIVLGRTKVSKISIGGDCCPVLETLELSSCRDLREIEILPGTLKTLNVKYCDFLKDIRGVCGLKELKSLQIEKCEELDRLPCFAELVSLEIFKLNGSSRVKRVEGLESLKSLEILKIRDCPELNGLPSLEELTSLEEIDLQMCHKLEKIEGLKGLPSVKILKIRDCPELNGLPSLEELTSLKEIDLQMCHKLEKIECLKGLTSVKILKIRDCPELNGLPSLRDLRNLRYMDLCSCKALKNLPSLGGLSSLETLSIIGCIQLEYLPNTIGYLESLNHICIESSRLRYLPEGLTQLVNLLTLKISGSPLIELDFGSGSLRNLRKINLSETHVTRISISKDCCPRLETLELSQNEYLEEIDPLPAGVRTIELSEYEILE